MVRYVGLRPLPVLRFHIHGSSSNSVLCQKQWLCIRPPHFIASPSPPTKVVSKVNESHEERHSETLVVGDETFVSKFEGVVDSEVSKLRLDQWLSRQLPHVSRARVQSSIRHGLAHVNGRPTNKVALAMKGGDHVQCRLIGPTPSEAEPEDIALEIAYEDEHLLVINKPAFMVVHPAPGHSSGTLVNALLHHCGLPSIRIGSRSSSQKGLLLKEEEQEGELELTDDADDDEKEALPQLPHEVSWSRPAPIIRPGIVHRLDKGTSGLLVVAKDDYTHEHLCNQFKARTVKRSYIALTTGLPPLSVGSVNIPIGRDPRDRKRMAALPSASSNTKKRSATSTYRVLEILAQGGAALVEWRLQTGRTHQIRVHAQHLGYPVLGDEMYGGTKGAAVSQLLPRCPYGKHGILKQLVSHFNRPYLHAQTLGFTHPWTGDDHHFKCPPPDDFEAILQTLRQCFK